MDSPATPAQAHSDLLGEQDLLGPEYVPARAHTSHHAPQPRIPSGTVVILPPNPAADSHGEKFMKLYTQNQIRRRFHQVTVENMDAVVTWIHEVAKDSPAKAVELFIELTKFSLPQLKEATLNVTRDNVTRTFTSSAEILAELNGEPVP